MKCILLAGGKGDRVWPLSRGDYPKQFMEIQENRTVFQETVARNMPYVDEFLVVANKEYQFIIDGQMETFQGIHYRCFLEEIPRKTTAAIVLAAMRCAPSEIILVAASDQIINGCGYKEAVMRGKELAAQGYLVTVGRKIEYPETKFGYIHTDGENVLEFIEKPDINKVKSFMGKEEYLWNSGMFLFRVGDLLNELKIYSPDISAVCSKIVNSAKLVRHTVVWKKEALEKIPKVAIEKAIFEKSKKVKVVNKDFEWRDIGSLEDLQNLRWNTGNNQIVNNCSNTTVINQADDQLVVVNQADDLLVVNTDDAVYIGKSGASGELKRIIREHPEKANYFEKQRINYRSWGLYEEISKEESFKVKKVTVFPGKTIYSHRHEHRSEHWSIVKGTALITLEGISDTYKVKDNIDINRGVSHQVSNIGEDELIVIEVSVGEVLQETDLISIASKDLSEAELGYEVEKLVKLEPTFKDYLWGGTKLRDIYGKHCDYDIVAESWELSAHDAGQSKIASGRHVGQRFGEYLEDIGKENWGWKCQSLDRFPILIKFIDARDNLSVQVHPNDDYALEVENEYGKNEMWYIVDCDEGSGIYCGFKHDVTREEVEQRVKDNTILDILNWIPVKKGEVYFIKSGTVHAIGKGILICEIQQSSNCTYRLYDFDRKDKFGNARELHLEKALDVLDYSRYGFDAGVYQLEKKETYTKKILSLCKYFECTRYQINSEMFLDVSDSSFISIICVSGEGNVASGAEELPFGPADSFFIPAGKKKIKITGKCEIIVTHV